MTIQSKNRSYGQGECGKRHSMRGLAEEGACSAGAKEMATKVGRREVESTEPGIFLTASTGLPEGTSMLYKT